MRTLLFLLFFVFSFSSFFSQITVSPEQFRKGSYLDLSGGFTVGKLKDEVISPLYYNSVGTAIEIDYSLYKNKSVFSSSFLVGTAIAMKKSKGGNYMGNHSKFELDFKYNYIVASGISDGLRFLPGVSLDNYFGFRINKHLQNAALSMDLMSAVSANFGLEFSFTKAEKRRKFLWLIPYTRKEKTYNLFGNIKLPLVAAYMRPKYTNPGNVTVLYSDVNPFEGYGSYFSGPVGLQTEIGYARVLSNGNMFRLAYTWNAFSTGKKSINRLNDARHFLSIGLVFKIK